jgi:hypothetical protein
MGKGSAAGAAANDDDVEMLDDRGPPDDVRSTPAKRSGSPEVNGRGGVARPPVRRGGAREDLVFARAMPLRSGGLEWKVFFSDEEKQKTFPSLSRFYPAKGA